LTLSHLTGEPQTHILISIQVIDKETLISINAL